MQVLRMFILLVCVNTFLGCQKSETPTPDQNDTMYFPPNTDGKWELQSMSGLGWDEGAITSLKDFLNQSDTKSFMILVNGRIAMEEYFNGHTPSADWAWNSAGKTLVSATVGIAQQKGLLNINDKVSKYLGEGWSSEPLEKENLITLRHLLTMTSGLNDKSELVTKSNLTFLADAGTRWSYSNVFRLLEDIVAAASHQDFATYFNTRIKSKIGMDGMWSDGYIFNIYHSNTRSMARFGLLALNKGKWKTEQIIDTDYFNSSINSSQAMNPAYGYLWWLNGKTKYIRPGSQTVFQGSVTPTAPSDMYAAKGAGGQLIYVLPDKKMVVVRMGDSSGVGDSTVAVGFENALWEKINALIK